MVRASFWSFRFASMVAHDGSGLAARTVAKHVLASAATRVRGIDRDQKQGRENRCSQQPADPCPAPGRHGVLSFSLWAVRRRRPVMIERRTVKRTACLDAKHASVAMIVGWSAPLGIVGPGLPIIAPDALLMAA